MSVAEDLDEADRRSVGHFIIIAEIFRKKIKTMYDGKQEIYLLYYKFQKFKLNNWDCFTDQNPVKNRQQIPAQ